MATEAISNDRLATMEDYAAAEFTALLSQADMEKLEKNAQSFGVTRRLGFGVLTRDKAQLVDAMGKEGTGASMLAMYDDFQEYAGFLRGQIEVVETASIRLLAAGAAAGLKAEQ